jgi:hypothetical protein
VAIALACVFVAGCPKATHPNQINEFDGKTYDSLMLSHEALATLRDEIQIRRPDHAESFNTAAVAYRDAYDSYASYRGAPGQHASQVAALVSGLAVAIAALENELTDELPVPRAKEHAIRVRAAERRRIATRSASFSVSIIDILTELQTGAELAKAVPQTGPYAGLAVILIQAAKVAITAAQANAARPIELALIYPIAPIRVI